MSECPQNVYEILTTARDIISKPKYWTKGNCARDEQGDLAFWDSKAAYCFCSYGAILRAALELKLSSKGATKSLRNHINAPGNDLEFGDIGIWNDSSTHEEVMNVFQLAIDDAK